MTGKTGWTSVLCTCIIELVMTGKTGWTRILGWDSGNVLYTCIIELVTTGKTGWTRILGWDSGNVLCTCIIDVLNSGMFVNRGNCTVIAGQWRWCTGIHLPSLVRVGRF